MKLSKLQWAILILVIVCGFALRFYRLGDWPEAFAADEAALGYNAWSLMTTRRDEWGKLLPLTLRSFDDDKPAMYSYLDIPFVAIFGLNEFSARGPAALFGSLLPIWIFVLVFRRSKKYWLALLSSAVIVFAPWHIEISRTAIEAGVALSIAMLGIMLFEFNNKKTDLLGFLFIIASLFTYHSARLVAPIILVLALITRTYKRSKVFYACAVILAVVGIILALTGSSMRFKQISIFTDLGAQLKREEAIREDGHPNFMIPALESRIIHNKPVSWVYSFTDSYLKNTSLSFLFLGGAQPPRVTIPEVGQFQLFLLPFFIIGLGVLLHRLKSRDWWILLWLLWAPVPASMTTAELPHTYRTLFMLPPIAVIIATGLWFGFTYMRKHFRWAAIPVVLLFLVLFGYNTFRDQHQYYVHQQVHQPWYRQYGYEHLITYLDSITDVHEFHITNAEGEPYIFVLFYNKIKPVDFQAWPEKRLAHADIDKGADHWQMFNYHFYQDPCPHASENGEKNPRDIYVVHGTCELPDGYERLKTITFMDEVPEFYVDRYVGKTNI